MTNLWLPERINKNVSSLCKKRGCFSLKEEAENPSSKPPITDETNTALLRFGLEPVADEQYRDEAQLEEFLVPTIGDSRP